MKLIKTILALSFSSLLISNVAYAEKAHSQQVVHKQASAKKDRNLQQFVAAVAINFLGRDVSNDQNGKPVLHLKFDLVNKTNNKDIKTLQWMAAFAEGNKIIFAKDIALNFNNTPLIHGTKATISVNIPVSELPAVAQKAMLNSQSKLKSIVGAKGISFTNGNKIIVK